MAVRDIEVNTSLLSADIRSLRAELAGLESMIDRMCGKAAELNAMRKEDAGAAFELQLASDRQAFGELCRVLRELTDSMDNAKNEYDQCEIAIGTMIGAIQV